MDLGNNADLGIWNSGLCIELVGWDLLAGDENVPVLWSRSLVLEHYSYWNQHLHGVQRSNSLWINNLHNPFKASSFLSDIVISSFELLLFNIRWIGQQKLRHLKQDFHAVHWLDEWRCFRLRFSPLEQCIGVRFIHTVGPEKSLQNDPGKGKSRELLSIWQVYRRAIWVTARIIKGISNPGTQCSTLSLGMVKWLGSSKHFHTIVIGLCSRIPGTIEGLECPGPGGLSKIDAQEEGEVGVLKDIYPPLNSKDIAVIHSFPHQLPFRILLPLISAVA